MQSAARVVLAENQRLRAILHRHGISPDESNQPSPRLAPAHEPEPHSGGITENTHAPRPAGLSPPKLPAQVTSKNLATPALARPQPPSQQEVASSPKSHKLVTETGRGMSRVASKAATSTLAVPSSIHGHDEAEGQWLDHNGHGCPERTASCDDGSQGTLFPPVSDCFCPPEAPQKRTYPTDLQTPCEAAAVILLDLQGHDDMATTRTNLGCTGANSCYVKNTTLFRLMDES